MSVNENWYQLPPDPNAWQAMIIANLARKIPDIPKYINSIEITNFDPAMGDADGMLYLLNGLAGIPIIIRSMRLAPMDVMVTPDEKFYPVTDVFIAKLYADNVIGEPAKGPHNDDVKEGPAYQVKSIPTIDHVKHASYEAKTALRDKLVKSAALLTFFNEHRPEILAEVLHAEPPKAEKIAADDYVAPELMYLAKGEDGGYYFNNEPCTVKEAADFLAMMHAPEDKRREVMQGSPICYDYREKLAMPVLQQDAPVPNDNSPYSIAVVLGTDNIPYRGLLVRRYNYCSPDYMASYAGGSSHAEYLFITKEFYAVQNDVLVTERRPVSDLSVIRSLSVPSDPAIGMLGVVADKNGLEGPFRVMRVERAGDMMEIYAADLVTMNENRYEVSGDRQFYAIPDERRSLMKNSYESFVAMPGEIVSVGLNPEGRLVYHDKAYSYANILYALMHSLNIGFDDSVKVAQTAMDNGSLVFKVASGEKIAGDAKKEDKKDSKPPAKAEDKKVETHSESKEKVHKNGDKTVTKTETHTEYGQPEQQEPQMVPYSAPTLPLNQPMPVNFDEIDDIAKVNDPKLMDAYLSGKLVDVNTAGREQLMQIGDDVFEAIKSLGKLLFITRMGQIDYVEEQDVQMALNKMSDIAKSIGLAASQVTPQTDGGALPAGASSTEPREAEPNSAGSSIW